jgi:hypothetical protein
MRSCLEKKDRPKDFQEGDLVLLWEKRNKDQDSMVSLKIYG